ncbi:MAG: helix-turn-helix transcriptional regulator [Clostridia bacterium]|nr:helix-turn-helix transcriptional regulator [Clostridia bacterium]
MNETIGAVIRRLRKEKSFTQEELAEQLGVTAQAVSKWENETGMPDISQIVPLATVFGVSTDVLFGRAGVSDKEDIEARLAVIFRYSDAVDGNEAAEGLKILDMYRNLLKDYPSNPTILLNAAAFGDMLTEYYTDGLREQVGQTGVDGIVQECIHWNEIVVKYASALRDILSGKRNLMGIYARLKRFEEAYALAKELPDDITETRDIRLAELKWEAGEKEEQRRLHCRNIDHLTKALHHQAVMLGNLYRDTGAYEDALHCYTFGADMIQSLFREEEYRPTFAYDGYTLFTFPAVCLMKLGRAEEAIDLLEKSVDFHLAQGKWYNKRTTVDTPLLRDNTYSYGFEGTAEYSKTRLKDAVCAPCLSPLADHPRYKALVECINGLLAE